MEDLCNYTLCYIFALGAPVALLYQIYSIVTGFRSKNHRVSTNFLDSSTVGRNAMEVSLGLSRKPNRLRKISSKNEVNFDEAIDAGEFYDWLLKEKFINPED